MLAILQSPQKAGAQQPDSSELVAQSNELFAEGKRQLAAGAVHEACLAFAKSDRLLSRGGTSLNLGLCLETEGRLPQAWRTLQHALALAQRDLRSDRVTLISQHLAAIEARLSWLVLQSAGDVAPSQLSVRLDQDAVAIAEWSAVPVEPGEHLLTVEASGYHARVLHVAVGKASEHLVVSLEPLQAMVVQSASAAAMAAEQPAAATHRHEDHVESAQHPRRRAFAALGIGLVGLAVGAVTGGYALSRHQFVEHHCAEHKVCDEPGWQAVQQGRRLSITTGIALAAGGVGLSTWMLIPGGPLWPSGQLAIVPTVVRRF